MNLAVVKRAGLTKSLFDEIALGFAFSIVLGMCSKIAFQAPFSPVPFVMQVSILLFFAAKLGSRGAVIMVGSFLLQGLIGLPVFAMGQAGAAVFMGPRGGYLVGYLAAAAIVGFLHERRTEKTSLALASDMAVGNLVIYFFGAAYLASFIGIGKAVVVGVLPFVLPDALKILALSIDVFRNRYSKDV